uniref:ZZ-type domain-containing protein n=1 Tax=Alexandrium monilatum TaxID=311494 RepID=A0A7S4T7B3_9DINO
MEFSDAAAFSAVLQEEKRSWRHYYLSNCLFYSFGVNNHPHFCSMDPQECFEHFHPGSGLPPVAADDSDESVDEAHRAYLSSLIQSLPDGTVVLYCIEEAPGRHVLHTISNKGLRGGHRVHLEDSEVSDAARAFSQEVVRLSRLRRLYGQLGRAIWQPLDALLADAAWVVCVCTGSLARLPLHALEWRGSPLCVQKLVSYGNSLTELSVLPPLRCRVGPQGLHGNPGCAAAAGDGVVHEGADGADGGAGRATAADEGVVHEGVMCDGCGACPIRGRRYKCSTCENYDLCWSCHASRDQVHVAGHGFSCLPRPSQEDVALLVSGPVRAVWSPLDGDEQTAMPELRYAVCEGHLVRSRLGAARCRCLSLQGQDVTLDALVALQMVHMLDSSAGSRIFMHIASHFCVADGPRDDGGPAQGGFVLSDGDVLRVPDFPKVFPRHACVVFLSACSTRGSECSGHDAAARAMTPNECGRRAF